MSRPVSRCTSATAYPRPKPSRYLSFDIFFLLQREFAKSKRLRDRGRKKRHAKQKSLKPMKKLKTVGLLMKGVTVGRRTVLILE